MGTRIEFPFRVPASVTPACRLLALQTSAFIPTAATPHHAALISSEDRAQVGPAHVPPICAVFTGFAFFPGVSREGS